MKLVSPLATTSVFISVSAVSFHPSSAFVPHPKPCSFCIIKNNVSRRRSRHVGRRPFDDGNNVHVDPQSIERGSSALGLDASITLLENDHQQEVAVANTTITNNGVTPMDRRPHEQRVSSPRKARRLNHPFQHLYRHSDPWWEDNDWNDTIAISDEVRDFYNDVLPGTGGNPTLDNTITLSSEQQQQQQQLCNNSTFAQQPIDVKTSLLAIQYLHFHGGYTFDEIRDMHAKFPPLFEMDVNRHLRPKMRFLKDCLGGAIAEQVLDPRLKSQLPANFFGARLERTIAPRHAFLVHVGLPSGALLWGSSSSSSNGNDDADNNNYNPSLLGEFLLRHRKAKQFAAMCNKWRTRYGSTTLKDNLPITSEQIVAFDKLFQRGILSAVRDDSGYIHDDDSKETGNTTRKVINNSPSPLQTANITSAQLVRYMIQHGSNPWETDVRGASLFHWASGCGNLDGLKELVDGCDRLESRIQASGTSSGTNPESPGTQAALLWKASRDDATPFHWAAAGAGPKEFGIGGHLPVCNYLMSLCAEHSIISQRKLINSQTRDGNTILMWSAWSRSLDIVKLLVRNRADTTKTNRNGCTVAHWAASGGDLETCQYLHKIAKVDFTVENYARNTPLSHTVAYGRFEVAKWLKEDLKVEDEGSNAEDLALDFINWADTGVGLISEEEEVERRSVYSLFNSFKDWRSEEIGESEDVEEQ